MSDCNDLIEIVRERNEEIRELKQKLAHKDCLIDAWQRAYEGLDRFAAMQVNKNREAV